MFALVKVFPNFRMILEPSLYTSTFRFGSKSGGKKSPKTPGVPKAKKKRSEPRLIRRWTRLKSDIDGRKGVERDPKLPIGSKLRKILGPLPPTHADFLKEVGHFLKRYVIRDRRIQQEYGKNELREIWDGRDLPGMLKISKMFLS